jgi:hypothetical protein
VDQCLFFCTFSFVIVLSVLLRFTASDNPFCIFVFFFVRFISFLTSTIFYIVIFEYEVEIFVMNVINFDKIGIVMC